MYFTLPFPKGAPIKENINEEGEANFNVGSSTDDDGFDF